MNDQSIDGREEPIDVVFSATELLLDLADVHELKQGRQGVLFTQHRQAFFNETVDPELNYVEKAPEYVTSIDEVGALHPPLV